MLDRVRNVITRLRDERGLGERDIIAREAAYLLEYLSGEVDRLAMQPQSQVAIPPDPPSIPAPTIR